MTDASLLRVAADYLQRWGWTQGQLGGNGKPACLSGALHEAIAIKNKDGALVYDLERIETLRQHLRAHPAVDGSPSLSLAYWNDTYGRTREDVVALLVETAHTLEEGQP